MFKTLHSFSTSTFFILGIFLFVSACENAEVVSPAATDCKLEKYTTKNITNKGTSNEHITIATNSYIYDNQSLLVEESYESQVENDPNTNYSFITKYTYNANGFLMKSVYSRSSSDSPYIINQEYEYKDEKLIKSVRNEYNESVTSGITNIYNSVNIITSEYIDGKVSKTNTQFKGITQSTNQPDNIRESNSDMFFIYTEDKLSGITDSEGNTYTLNAEGYISKVLYKNSQTEYQYQYNANGEMIVMLEFLNGNPRSEYYVEYSTLKDPLQLQKWKGKGGLQNYLTGKVPEHAVQKINYLIYNKDGSISKGDYTYTYQGNSQGYPITSEENRVYSMTKNGQILDQSLQSISITYQYTDCQ